MNLAAIRAAGNGALDGVIDVQGLKDAGLAVIGVGVIFAAVCFLPLLFGLKLRKLLVAGACVAIFAIIVGGFFYTLGPQLFGNVRA